MKIPKKLKKLSLEHNRPLGLRALKLSEECGEVAEAVLIHLGEKGKPGEYDKKIENIVEECVDVVIMSMDILVHLGEDNEKRLSKLMHKKLAKWEKFIENKKKHKNERSKN